MWPRATSCTALPSSTSSLTCRCTTRSRMLLSIYTRNTVTVAAGLPDKAERLLKKYCKLYRKSEEVFWKGNNIHKWCELILQRFVVSSIMPIEHLPHAHLTSLSHTHQPSWRPSKRMCGALFRPRRSWRATRAGTALTFPSTECWSATVRAERCHSQESVSLSLVD